jgi:hypothetical protein
MTQEELKVFTDGLSDSWPNCAVPDCEYKSNWPESSMCCFHQRGEVPPPFEEYMRREPIDN